MNLTAQYESTITPSFWEGFMPALAVKDTDTIKLSWTDASGLVTTGARETGRLHREGYARVSGAVPVVFANMLGLAIEKLGVCGIPPVFVFMYAEAWRIFHFLDNFLSDSLGIDYMTLPDFWAWSIEPSEEGKGWGPHRDKAYVAIEEDGRPHSLTCWLPLSEATPENGCMYVLPMHLDEASTSPLNGVFPSFLHPSHVNIKNVQDVRAVPASPGDALVWNQNIVHWGARASRLARVPRRSIAMEFQTQPRLGDERRREVRRMNVPLMPSRSCPSFRVRLFLIAKQITQYQHMYPVDEVSLGLAKMIIERGGK